MIVVNVEVASVNEKPVDGEIRIIKRVGSIDTIDKSWAVTSGSEGAKRKILLNNDERVEVVSRQKEELVYDRENNAAVPASSLDERRTPAENEEVERLRQEEVKLRQAGDEEKAKLVQQATSRAEGTDLADLKKAGESKTPPPALGQTRPAVSGQSPQTAPPHRPNVTPNAPTGTQAGAVHKPGTSSPTGEAFTGDGAKSSKEVK